MKYDLVVFDLDGVLVTPTSSWVWVHQHYGTNNDASLEEYNQGGIDDHEFMRRDIALWKGKKNPIHYEDVVEILNAAPIMPGAEETIGKLKKEGIPTAIISGGLVPLARRVADELGMDYIYANDLDVNAAGELVGEGILSVKLRDKGSPFSLLVEELGLPLEKVAAVGNSHIDIPMLEKAGLGIAFNPADEDVMDAADVVVGSQDLRDILPFLGL